MIPSNDPSVDLYRLKQFQEKTIKQFQRTPNALIDSDYRYDGLWHIVPISATEFTVTTYVYTVNVKLVFGLEKIKEDGQSTPCAKIVVSCNGSERVFDTNWTCISHPKTEVRDMGNNSFHFASWLINFLLDTQSKMV